MENKEFNFNKKSQISEMQLFSKKSEAYLEGYYFSYTYDLSLSKQKQAQKAPRDWRFAWNSHMCRDLIAAQIKDAWTIPVVQGFISSFQVYVASKKLDFYLIVRRSSKKAGTRYNARGIYLLGYLLCVSKYFCILEGIDKEGYVANYNEIEQIIYFNQYCCSHLQIRGSAPIFWQQTGITAHCKISKSYENTNSCFLQHFQDIKKNYGFVICINLMQKSKSSEQLITEGYETHVRYNNLNYVKYKYFDFHQNCKNEQYEKVNPTIRELHKYNRNFLYYMEDIPTRTAILAQKGVFRTNCLDCLDRTNVFQSKIALDILVVQLQAMGANIEGKIIKKFLDEFGEDPLDHIDNSKKGQCDAFTLKFKEIWANCGDMISKHYTGTGSTHTDVTRDGTRTFTGLIQHGQTTLNRFYKYNFEDNIKQQTIDLILGQNTEYQSVSEESEQENQSTIDFEEDNLQKPCVKNEKIKS